MANKPNRQVYIEYVPVGIQIKVSAIDSATGTEVSIIAPKTATRNDMESLALRKLQRALERLDAGQ